MSTRADFYQGRGASAIYLGSIGHDAHVDAMAPYFEAVTTLEQFQAQLAGVFRDYGEIPAANGWPWPWADSASTGTVVAFDVGTVWTSHYSKRWAPLNDCDNPTDLICRFPNMEAALKATAQGRLASKLRFRGDVVGPAESVLVNATVAAVRALSLDWMHVINHQGELGYLSGLHHAARAYTLSAMAEVFRENPEDFDEAFRALKGGQPDTVWDLLEWVKDHVYHGDKTEFFLDVQPGVTPMYFARPTPEFAMGEGVRAYGYTRVQGGEAAARGLVLWNRVLDAAPRLFVQAITRALHDLGAIPVEAGEVDAWMGQPHPELDGATLEELAATFDGRERVRDFAHALLFRM